MTRNPKLYSCGQAAKHIGCTRDWLQKLARAGRVGQRVAIPGTDDYRFLISEKEIRTLTAAKKLGKTLSDTFSK